MKNVELIDEKLIARLAVFLKNCFQDREQKTVFFRIFKKLECLARCFKK